MCEIYSLRDSDKNKPLGESGGFYRAWGPMMNDMQSLIIIHHTLNYDMF